MRCVSYRIHFESYMIRTLETPMNKGPHPNSKPLGRHISSSTDTREDGIYVFIPTKRNPYQQGWIMNAQDALESLAADKDFTGETYRVLLHVMAKLDFENWVLLTQTEIAKALEMKRPNVSRQFALLEKKEVLLRGPKAGSAWTWRLNPEYGWKGKVKSLNAYRRQRRDS